MMFHEVVAVDNGRGVNEKGVAAKERVAELAEEEGGGEKRESCWVLWGFKIAGSTSLGSKVGRKGKVNGGTGLELAYEDFLEEREGGDAHGVKRTVLDEVLEKHQLGFFLRCGVDDKGRDEAEGQEASRGTRGERRHGAQ